jgi:hypothetical protein
VTDDTKRELKKTAAFSAVIVATFGGLILQSEKLSDPLRLEWDNAPGATITDIWGTTNLADWYHVGRVTNAARWIIEKKHPAEFYRVSHPNGPGHYWDGVGKYRQD